MLDLDFGFNLVSGAFPGFLTATTPAWHESLSVRLRACQDYPRSTTPQAQAPSGVVEMALALVSTKMVGVDFACWEWNLTNWKLSLKLAIFFRATSKSYASRQVLYKIVS
jgi:hypothetical protein